MESSTLEESTEINESAIEAECDASPSDEPTDPKSPEPDAEADEDWDVEMDLGKTGGAKAVPSPPPNASSSVWHSSMAAATSGFTGVVTRLGGPKSDVEETWDEFDLDF
ncbi:hypothetical protein FRC16_000730, partial [Serendipita sp. 398]